MLAGRKLLLADDSITIQRVVDLTFADEGMEVVSFSNGRDAIDKLLEFHPDVVLADVFMPQASGYEVCEFIKQNEQLKHIPVILLVGSFEPFDDAEAHRVGADDTLTKPFQSIRNLIDKVGALVGGRPAEEQVPTAELLKPEVEKHQAEPEPERLSEAQINFVTADTQPLPMELRHMVEETAARQISAERVLVETQTKMDERAMEPETTQSRSAVPERPGDAGDIANVTLLDLGNEGTVAASESDEFVLDIDLDETSDDGAYQPSAYVRPPVYKSPPRDWKTSAAGSRGNVATADQLARTQEFPAAVSEIVKEAKVETGFGGPSAPAKTESVDGGSSSATLSSLAGVAPEVIDAIARRAVEQLSEKVVREIAWDVVPDLAELLIKRQLEEKQS